MEYGRYKNPTDKRLLSECAAIGSGKVPCKVWSPDGYYWVSTCATIDDMAGSIVADGLAVGLISPGMEKGEYWEIVAGGYLSNMRSYRRRVLENDRKEYADAWVERYLEFLD